jgi:hypothetical protein
MDKPASYPDWATESANVTAPPEARVRLGWELNDRPSSSVFNWWKNITGRWIRYIDDVVANHSETLAALSPWRSDISRRLQAVENDLSRQIPDSLASLVHARALRARYALPRQKVADLEVIAPNSYRLPVEGSAINVDAAHVRTSSANEFRFSIDFSLELGPDEALVVFSQADNISSRMHLTTHHLERSRIVDDTPRNAELDVIVRVYDPDAPPSGEQPTGTPMFVPGLNVVAF